MTMRRVDLITEGEVGRLKVSHVTVATRANGPFISTAERGRKQALVSPSKTSEAYTATLTLFPSFLSIDAFSWTVADGRAIVLPCVSHCS
jgi:hypothetical protein